MRRDADRPRSRPASAVRRREGLVQIDVDDVEAHRARLDLAEDGVEVRTVVVQQPARGVHDVADVEDALLEHAERGGIGQHQTRGLRPDRGAQALDVDIAVAIGGDLAHREAAHGRGGGIGAVRRIRHDDLRARVVATRGVPRANHRHTGELALGARHRRAG